MDVFVGKEGEKRKDLDSSGQVDGKKVYFKYDKEKFDSPQSQLEAIKLQKKRGQQKKAPPARTPKQEPVKRNVPERKTITEVPMLEKLKTMGQEMVTPEQEMEKVQQTVQTVGETASGFKAGEKEAQKDSGIDLPDFLSNPDFLVGAAPMLMGFLTGYTEEGARYASKGLLQRYEDTREDAQLELKAKQKLSEKSPKMKAVYNPKTGKSIYMPESEVAGLEVGSSSKDLPFSAAKDRQDIQKWLAKGGNLTVGTNDMGEKVWVDKFNREITPVQQTQGLAPVHRKTVTPMLKEYNKKAPALKENYDLTMQSIKDLARNNKFGSKMAVMQLVKQIEGRMTDQDRDFYTLPYGLWKKTLQKIESAPEDQLPLELRKEVMELLSQSVKRNKKQLSTLGGKYKRDVKTIHPSFPQGKLNTLFATDLGKSESMKLYNPETQQTADVPMEDVWEAREAGFTQFVEN